MQFNEIFTVAPIHYDTERPCVISPQTHYARSFVVLKISPKTITQDPGTVNATISEDYLGRHEICENCYGQMLYNMTKVHKDLQDLKNG